ncbi:hypothetical protein C4569_04125 [Candidatus Parcubacteria bacterium]|nr:MAG: hypothetical protein C4569_04125 [Candidatus Parcubacteria bacterium]
MAAEDLNDEIIFKDEDGRLKMISGDKIIEIEENKAALADNELNEEEEIRLLKKKAIKPTVSFDFAKIAREILAKADFIDSSLKERFYTIILLRLKDVRDRLETKKMLMRSVEKGGMGFKIGKAENISRVIETKYDALINNAGILQTPDEIKEPPTVKPLARPFIPDLILPVKPAGKNNVSKTKLTGPLEEIEEIDLFQFRRFSKNPREATDKIYEKIKIQQNESLEMYLKAVKSWNKSPLNRLYLEMANQALDAGLTVEDLINRRSSEKIDCLTLEEFKSVMDFNKKLRKR